MWTTQGPCRYGSAIQPSTVTVHKRALVERPTACRARRQRQRSRARPGLMHILLTGCQWWSFEDLPPRSTIHGYFDLRAVWMAKYMFYSFITCSM